MKTSKRQAKARTTTKGKVSTPRAESSKSTCEVNSEFEEMLRRIDTKGSIFSEKLSHDSRPTYGTVVYLAECPVEMRSGNFTAYVFQDLIHKGYIIAMAHGDVRKAKALYVRIHSSCVTSETLRGCDCDCVQQLEGAIKRITDEGSGILFYLIQEGRGVGYTAKARDRMLVQASQDSISTFKAYELLGLKKDYRNYGSIKSICHLLGITAPFVLLTNNPDKVEALKNLGIPIKKTDRIEYDPGPHNLAYLTSKAESGHKLKKTKNNILAACRPPEPVVPFTPYALKDAPRFVYVASYFLPMKPIDGEVLLDKEQYRSLFGTASPKDANATRKGFIKNVERISGDRYIVTINRKRLRQHREKKPSDPMNALLSTPYWFRIHTYYDLVSGEDYIILVFGTPSEGKTPMVRVHSESIFNRFPLENVQNRDRFKGSVRHIVRNGSGVLLLLHNDGRGAGFGAYATSKMIEERGAAADADESYRQLGVEYDTRDYNAAMALVRRHIGDQKIQMIMVTPESIARKSSAIDALHLHDIHVERWIFLEES